LTSWTMDKSTAEIFAGEHGVVLEVVVPSRRCQFSPDIWNEREVLVKGCVAAKVVKKEYQINQQRPVGQNVTKEN